MLDAVGAPGGALNAAARRGTISAMPPLPSPCTKDCKIDPANGLCRGCLRTIEEIVRWSGAGDAEKERILAAVAGRWASRAQAKRTP